MLVAECLLGSIVLGVLIPFVQDDTDCAVCSAEFGAVHLGH